MASSEGQDDGPVFHPQDAIGEASKTAMATGAVGLLIATTQNTLARQNLGVVGAIRQAGGVAGLFRE